MLQAIKSSIYMQLSKHTLLLQIYKRNVFSAKKVFHTITIAFTLLWSIRMMISLSKKGDIVEYMAEIPRKLAISNDAHCNRIHFFHAEKI